MTLKIDAVDRKNQSVYLWLLAGIKRVFMSVCRIMQSRSAFAPVHGRNWPCETKHVSISSAWICSIIHFKCHWSAI